MCISGLSYIITDTHGIIPARLEWVLYLIAFELDGPEVRLEIVNLIICAFI